MLSSQERYVPLLHLSRRRRRGLEEYIPADYLLAVYALQMVPQLLPRQSVHTHVYSVPRPSPISREVQLRSPFLVPRGWLTAVKTS